MTNRRQQRILKSSIGVACATLLSRLLGLVRVMFEAMTLGGGAAASAWQLAFMAPNLFRRLLGEGALGTAMIPMIAHTEARRGMGQVRKDLAVILTALTVLLSLITVTVSAAAALMLPHVTAVHNRMALRLLPFLMPYAIPICLVGVICAILNSRKVFFLPALSALLLNVFLIAGLSVRLWQHDGPLYPFLKLLSLLVLVSGSLQLALMIWLLFRRGVFPDFRELRRRCWSNHRRVLGELYRLVLPGFIGGAALQVSFLADRILASYLGPQAVPALSYTDRIIDLPIGIFALSLGSVLMANMSNAAAHEDLESLGEDLAFGLRQVYFVCVPMAVFVMVFREPVIRILFLHGNFTTSDLSETCQAALFYGAGIPAFCSQKVILPAFYARKKMLTPLRVSLLCIFVNLILNLILMWPLRQGGIALATVVSAFLNNTLLLRTLRREDVPFKPLTLASTLMRTLAASSAAAGCFFIYPHLQRRLTVPVAGELAPFLIALVCFSSVYLASCWLLGCREPREMLRIFIGNSERRTTHRHHLSRRDATEKCGKR